jgi:hypothetical protein
MEFFMDALQSGLIDMGVYLGGGDVRMAEHHLYGAKVGAVAEEMGGEGVADHVGGDILGDPGSKCVFANDLPEPQAGHAGAAPGHEEEVAPFAL